MELTETLVQGELRLDVCTLKEIPWSCRVKCISSFMTTTFAWMLSVLMRFLSIEVLFPQRNAASVRDWAPHRHACEPPGEFRLQKKKKDAAAGRCQPSQVVLVVKP